MDPVQLTSALVAINSVNPFQTVVHEGRVCGLGNEANINVFIEDLLRRAGFDVERQMVQEEIVSGTARIPARWNLLAKKGTAKRSLLLFGHTDTVDVKAGWETDPFVTTSRVVDGRERFSALGANDMKSGLAAILCAAETAAARNRSLKLAFLVDEEFWSFGAVRLLQSDFLEDVDLALVPEISEDARVGSGQWLGLGRLGRSEFLFSVTGQACHGADAFVDPNAVNAVHEAVKLESIVIDYCASRKHRFEQEGVAVVNSAYLNLHEGGRGILSVPDSASFVLDRSFVPGESSAEELHALEALVKKALAEGRIDSRATVKVTERPRPTPPCKPYFFSPTLPVVQTVRKIAERVAGEVELGIGRSVADENRLAERGIPTIILGPTGAKSHTSSEWVDVESIRKLGEMYTAVCGELL